MARSVHVGEVGGTRGLEETDMNSKDADVVMLKMVSATIGYALGIGVTFSTVIIVLVALLQ
jgi:uncharacterized membrane protein